MNLNQLCEILTLSPTKLEHMTWTYDVWKPMLYIQIHSIYTNNAILYQLILEYNSITIYERYINMGYEIDPNITKSPSSMKLTYGNICAMYC